MKSQSWLFHPYSFAQVFNAILNKYCSICSWRLQIYVLQTPLNKYRYHQKGEISQSLCSEKGSASIIDVH